jgi:hypothetical protein
MYFTRIRSFYLFLIIVLPLMSKLVTGKTTNNPLNVAISGQYCIDHFVSYYYDGFGHLYIAGAQPDESIHISRADCNGFPQGLQLIHTFPTEKMKSFSLSFSGDSGYCSGSKADIDVRKPFQVVFTDCVWGDGGAQFPNVQTTMQFIASPVQPTLSPTHSPKIRSRLPTLAPTVADTSSDLICRLFEEIIWESNHESPSHSLAKNYFALCGPHDN